MKEFISVEEARSIILEKAQLRPGQTHSLEDILGMTLSEGIISRDNIPPFTNSAMDGYAVHTRDLDSVPTVLEVTGIIPAGSVPEAAIEPGKCIQIMTGAPCPPGANAVVPVEWTTAAGASKVQINRRPIENQNIRLAGKDVQIGDEVLEEGERVTPPVLGMLASMGVHQVAVRKPPRVAIVATGDELIRPEEALAPGKIRNSSGPALTAQVIASGAAPMPPLLARDNPASIAEAIEKALEADVLVFAGGVSVGEYDLIKAGLDAAGMKMAFWKVRQRPGKPLAFGVLQGKPVIGLPGNPVSSAICFDQYVRPLIWKMLGRKSWYRNLFKATLLEATPKVEGLHFFARGIASQQSDGTLAVRTTGPQASNLYSSVVQANCIMHLPASWSEAQPGDQVDIEWFDW